MSGALAVIAKAPVAGRVKTRLCPPCTPEQAALIAAAALEDTLRAVRSAPAARRILVLDGAPDDCPDLAGFEVIRQRGSGLAERLAAAFADIAAPAFLVGMDTPQLRPADLAEGLTALTSADAVLGSAADGGYWGIGLRAADPEVFRAVPMSLDSTADAQRARLDELGLRRAELRELTDVDTYATALEVAAGAPGTAFAAAVGAAAARTESGAA